MFTIFSTISLVCVLSLSHANAITVSSDEALSGINGSTRDFSDAFFKDTAGDIKEFIIKLIDLGNLTYKAVYEESEAVAKNETTKLITPFEKDMNATIDSLRGSILGLQMDTLILKKDMESTDRNLKSIETKEDGLSETIKDDVIPKFSQVYGQIDNVKTSLLEAITQSEGRVRNTMEKYHIDFEAWKGKVDNWQGKVDNWQGKVDENFVQIKTMIQDLANQIHNKTLEDFNNSIRRG